MAQIQRVYKGEYFFRARPSLYNISSKTMKIIFQTDNGSEFIGSVRKKIGRKSLFEEIVGNNLIDYQRIPPRSPTFPPEVDPPLADNLRCRNIP